MLRLQTALGTNLPPVDANITPEDLRRSLYNTTRLYSHCNIRLVQDGKLIKDVFFSNNLVVVVESPLEISDDINIGISILSSRYKCEIMTTGGNNTNSLTPQFISLLSPYINKKHEPVIVLLCYGYHSRAVVLERTELRSILLTEDTNTRVTATKNQVAALLHRDFRDLGSRQILTLCVSQNQIAMFVSG